MTTKDLIQELSSKTAQSLEFVTQHFKRLSSNQRNWKKDANSWSINETFAHLNAFATYYHATFLYKFEIVECNGCFAHAYFNYPNASAGLHICI